MFKPNNKGSDFFDLSCLWRLDFLTLLGRRYLPAGYWGDSRSFQASQNSQKSNALAQPVFLTFDDGPHPATTPYLLELLEEENVTAAFFVLGRRVRRYPELASQIIERGHAIANHSFNHYFLPLLAPKKMEAEIKQTSEIIHGATGRVPHLFRPPFGVIDRRGAEYVNELSMKMVYWGPVSEDWKPIGVKRVVERTMKRVTSGSIIVLHEGKIIGKQTAKAASEIIKRTKELGFKFSCLETIVKTETS